MIKGGTVEQWNSGSRISEDAEWRNILKRRMPFCLNKSLKKLNLIKKRNIIYCQQAKLKGTELHIKGKLFIIGKIN